MSGVECFPGFCLPRFFFPGRPMKTPAFNTTVLFYPRKNPRLRLLALWYFTALITVWNILGHTILGFEQSDAATFVGIGTALVMQFFLEWVDAAATSREVRWAGSRANFFNALPAALIPGFACSMLLYPNERLWPIAFAAALSIASKVLFRAPVGDGRTQHIFNPSNIGIAATLLLFPQVGFAPPYHFTENLTTVWNWFLPVFILFTGLLIHGCFTGRLPLAAAWVIGFALQGEIRSLIYGFPPLVPLMPMTSAAFIVFTLYMVPDPATTPLNPWRQVAFGFSVAMVYGLIQVLHLVFGLFFALLVVCAIRGVSLHLYFAFKSRKAALPHQPATATA
jgi:enediyne biosynthesis protein E5